MPCAVKRARLTASKIFQRLFPLEYEEGVWEKIQSIRLEVEYSAQV